MEDKPNTTVRLYSYEEDVPQNGYGLLIPARLHRRPGDGRPTRHQFTPASALVTRRRRVTRLVLVTMSALALMIVSGAGFAYVSSGEQAASPTLSIIDRHTNEQAKLTFGPQAVLSDHSVYLDVRDEFIDARQTFIEVDLGQSQLRYFKNGVLYESAEIIGVPENGSWWDVPSGLYELEQKDESAFSTVGQAEFPWRLLFQRNFAIHGWPTYPDGSDVMEEFTGGGIRLLNADAKELYELVTVGTPILVHKQIEPEIDTFVYEPRIPQMEAPHYFVADIDNDTVLAASDLDAVAPIASLTKLMTAVVAAEQLELDGRIQVTSPTFVTSLIPRLTQGGSVSTYSLLQLLLVESSNEAAETIAGEVGRADFIAAMNAKARQLGMLSTNFVDPSGLGAENTSTIGDLFRLVKYIYEDRSFIFEITANEEVPDAYIGGEFYGLMNFNEIEGVEGFVGGKVGETNAAGQTSISLHQLPFKDELRTVAVIILGSDGRTKDVTDLLTYVKQRFASE